MPIRCDICGSDALESQEIRLGHPPFRSAKRYCPHQRLALLVVAISIFLNPIRSEAESRYSLTDLGSWEAMSVAAINNDGQVACNVTTNANRAIALLLSGERSIDICASIGGASHATGMNDQGQVVGWAFPGNKTRFRAFVYQEGHIYGMDDKGGLVRADDAGNSVGDHAFLYDKGRVTDLGTLGGFYSYAQAINHHSQVVGSAYKDGFVSHAFLFEDGSMIDIGSLGGTNSSAKAINNKGHIVGYSATAQGATHAFLFVDGKMSDLGTLGGTNSYAQAINEHDQIVGYSDTISNTPHAFLYSSRTMDDLGTLGGTHSHASGINSKGQVVGWASTIGSNAFHSFVSVSGIMTDLNSFAGPNSGWFFQSGPAINDVGQIAAIAFKPPREYHAFLLTPLPEQPTVAGPSSTSRHLTPMSKLLQVGMNVGVGAATLVVILVAWRKFRREKP